MTDRILEVEGLTFGYGREPVLSDVSFTACRGEFMGILGPNGAGKSTLVHLCCRLLQPDSGRISLCGRALDAWPRRTLAREMALVPQDTGVTFPFTVEETVLMGRAPYLGLFGVAGSEDIARAHAAMDAAGVRHLARRPMDRLSGGERQRVLLARALAQEPSLLFCDEPTAHLDIRHQVGVCDLLWSRAREGGLAVVAVLHDLNLAAAYCDRILLLDRGRPAALGRVEEVLTYRTVKAVYGTEIWVGVNELTGARYLIPVAGHRRDA